MRRLLLAPLLAGLIMPAAMAGNEEPTVEATLADALSTSATVQVIAPLRLHLEKHSPLQLVANLALPGQKLLLERDGKAIEIREQPAAVERFTLAEDGKAARYVVRLLAADGQELARESLNLQPATASLQLHVTANQVFGKKLSPLAATVGAGELSLLLDGQSIHQQNITQAGTLVLPALPLAPGRHRLQLELDTGGRKITSPAIQIFSFGIEPLDHDWLLADKYNFTLYWIRQGVLHRIYPVATGRPGLPTQPGFWLIGNKDVWFPASDWGSYRLRIYRENQYLTHWSGYAVHGTNKPGSIGTEASHGCLRMYNKDVTELYQGIEIGMPLLIEEKLPVYIDTIAPPKS